MRTSFRICPRARVLHRAAAVHDHRVCPSDLSIYVAFASMSNGAPQVCQGGFGYNGWNEVGGEPPVPGPNGLTVCCSTVDPAGSGAIHSLGADCCLGEPHED